MRCLARADALGRGIARRPARRAERQIERLRQESADRAERDRDAVRRDRVRLRRENERLRKELDAARRAGKRQAAPFSVNNHVTCPPVIS